MNILNFLLRTIFPENVTCIICRDEDTYKYGLCKKCFDKLKRTDGNRCKICLDAINTEGLCAACFNSPPDYKRLYCSFVYGEPIKNCLLLLKSGRGGFLKHQFSDIALDTIPEEILKSCTLITSVPASPARLRERGYNQAALIGKELSKKTKIPYRDTLKRTNDTKTALLDKAERLKSIKNQFARILDVKDETVLLIDDICTTGSTLRACAHQLKLAGAKEIFCFTVARTDKKL